MIKRKLFLPYIFHLILYLYFIMFAFIVDTPTNILNGMINIVLSPDILITDYMVIGGIGATLVNVAITSSACVFLLILNGIKPNGATLMSLWLIGGFSFFGKNIINIWPIMFGVFLYSKYQKEPFLNYTLVTLLATTLSPTINQIRYISNLNPFISTTLGFLISVFMGFILPPISSHCIKAHKGYNLYNIGFAGGLIAMFLMSFLRAKGLEFENTLYWYTGNDTILVIFMFIISIYFIALAFIYGDNPVQKLKLINKQSGILVSDFFIMYKESTYLNVGILSLLSTILLLILGADFNGPTIGSVFTIIGFGFFGKHFKNVWPIILGAILGSFVYSKPITSPNIIISVLLSTGLAPIAGMFGPLWGIISGFLHIMLVTNLVYLHGGLNLYNNGLSCGFVAMIIIPIITIFKKE